MVTKSKQKASKKKSGKRRVKVLNLKRETIKELTGGHQKKIKGGSGANSGILMGSRAN